MSSELFEMLLVANPIWGENNIKNVFILNGNEPCAVHPLSSWRLSQKNNMGGGPSCAHGGLLAWEDSCQHQQWCSTKVLRKHNRRHVDCTSGKWMVLICLWSACCVWQWPGHLPHHPLTRWCRSAQRQKSRWHRYDRHSAWKDRHRSKGMVDMHYNQIHFVRISIWFKKKPMIRFFFSCTNILLPHVVLR